MFKITNNWIYDFIGRYDGIDFVFPVGKAVYCEDQAAEHIFGLSSPDKTPVLVRHGWANFNNTYADGMHVLESFTFERVALPSDAPMAHSLLNAPATPATDHGPAPVGQDAAANAEGTDGPPATVAAVETSGAKKRGRPAGFDQAFEQA